MVFHKLCWEFRSSSYRHHHRYIHLHEWWPDDASDGGFFMKSLSTFKCHCHHDKFGDGGSLQEPFWECGSLWLLSLLCHPHPHCQPNCHCHCNPHHDGLVMPVMEAFSWTLSGVWMMDVSGCFEFIYLSLCRKPLETLHRPPQLLISHNWGLQQNTKRNQEDICTKRKHWRPCNNHHHFW